MKGGLQGGHRKANLLLGIVHALCRNAPKGRRTAQAEPKGMVVEVPLCCPALSIPVHIPCPVPTACRCARGVCGHKATPGYLPFIYLSAIYFGRGSHPKNLIKGGGLMRGGGWDGRRGCRCFETRQWLDWVFMVVVVVQPAIGHAN